MISSEEGLLGSEGVAKRETGMCIVEGLIDGADSIHGDVGSMDELRCVGQLVMAGFSSEFWS